jgi:hypothetical protein
MDSPILAVPSRHQSTFYEGFPEHGDTPMPSNQPSSPPAPHASNQHWDELATDFFDDEEEDDPDWDENAPDLEADSDSDGSGCDETMMKKMSICGSHLHLFSQMIPSPISKPERWMSCLLVDFWIDKQLRSNFGISLLSTIIPVHLLVVRSVLVVSTLTSVCGRS